MADSSAFSYVCERLEQDSTLDRLEARGTVRLALKQSGLEARDVTPAQMRVVLEKVLPRELSSRGVEDAEGLCRTVVSGLGGVRSEAAGEAPDEVFARLGGA